MGAGTRTRSSSGTCGAPTSSGGRCERRVAEGGRCPLHNSAGLPATSGPTGAVTVTAARPQPGTATYRSAPAAPAGLAGSAVDPRPASSAAGSGGWRQRLSDARQAWGRWKCRAGLHSLRPVPGATVDDNFCHDEQCRRCGKVVKIAYSGI